MKRFYGLVKYWDITVRNVDDVESDVKPALITEFGLVRNWDDENLYLIKDLHDDGAGVICVIPLDYVEGVWSFTQNRKVKIK